MGSIVRKIRNLKFQRLSTQLATLVVLNLPLLGVQLGMQSVACPVFFCHSCPSASMACPLGVLTNFAALKIWPFITIGILGTVGMIGGRFVCGWMCPFGMLQDWLHKIPSRKFKLPRVARWTKYAVLVVLVLAVPFFLPGKPYTFCNFCPSGTLESAIPWSFMGVSKGLGASYFMRLGILAAVLAFAVFVSRGFCQALCPLGAIFAAFNRISLGRIRLTTDNCNNCGVCATVCPTDIDPVADINSGECVRCLDCTTTCHLKMGIK